MTEYIKRELTNTLQKYIKIFPVTLITGPRQSGKSTFLQQELKDYTYLTFDDYNISNFFRDDPEGFFSRYKSKVILDEVQKEPDLFNYIKKNVDTNRQEYGKYVLSGSNQFVMMKNITESLAGRIGILELLPFQRSEIPKDISEISVFKGSYPEIITRQYFGVEEWYSSYIETYINKDVKQLANIGDIRDFKKLIQLLAANTSQILNMNTYSKELGVSVPTIKRWISVLEASYIIFLLQPYHNNIKKRIIKSPKIYFYDTGLVSYITGIQTEKLFEFGPMGGAIYENYIVAEVLKFMLHNNLKHNLSYLRTNNDLEIDLILQNQNNSILLEIKKSNTSNIKMLSTIRSYIKKEILIQKPIPINDQLGYLVYRGENFEYDDNLKAINYDFFLRRELQKIFL